MYLEKNPYGIQAPIRPRNKIFFALISGYFGVKTFLHFFPFIYSSVDTITTTNPLTGNQTMNFNEFFFVMVLLNPGKWGSSVEVLEANEELFS